MVKQNSKKENDSNGWKVIGNWRFTVAVFTFTSIGIFLGLWATETKFKYLELFTIYLSILLFTFIAWLALLYKRYSEKLNLSIEQLDLLQKIIKDTELKRAIKEQKWLIRSEIVEKNEMSDKVTENWTLTPNFYYELVDFKEAVINNFIKNLTPNAKTTKYKYIYVDNEDARTNLDRFRTEVVREVSKNLPEQSWKTDLLQLNRFVKLFPIKEHILPINEGIHNPNGEDRMGLLMTPEKTFDYYIALDSIRTHALTIKFRQLMEMSQNETKKSEKAFLISEFIDEVSVSEE